MPCLRIQLVVFPRIKERLRAIKMTGFVAEAQERKDERRRRIQVIGGNLYLYEAITCSVTLGEL